MTTPLVIDTPHGELKLHVCKDGTLDNDDWIDIYNASFPPNEQQDIEELKLCLEAGSMELDETRDEKGRIMCMTITEVFRPRHKHIPFLLACYTAVVPELRGLGIGTVHRRKLEELLRNEYGHFRGIFTEIESTKVSGLSPEAMDIRQRRKRFFLKLGLQPLDVDYRFPSTTEPGKDIEGELLWLPFEKASTLSRETIAEVMERIYIGGYGLRADDPFVLRMLSQFSESGAEK